MSRTPADDGEAEGIAEQEESLLDTEGAEEDATVGVILHGLGHEGGFGGEAGKLCVRSYTGRKSSPATVKVARLRREKSCSAGRSWMPAHFCRSHASLR